MEWIYRIWTEIGYGEGFIFTLWLVGLYWGKKRLDYHFARKTSKVVHNVKLVGGEITTHPRKY